MEFEKIIYIPTSSIILFFTELMSDVPVLCYLETP